MTHCVDNVKKSMFINQVVVASPHPIPEKVNAETFIGDEADVLDRYYQCAKKYCGKTIIRITADCPFIDQKIIDQAILYYFKSYFEYVCFAPIDGLDVEVFSFELLKEAWTKAKDPYDREHVTPYMRRKTKLSIDTKEDLLKARRWYELYG